MNSISKDSFFCDCCGRLRQSTVTPYVEVNVADNWVDTSVAAFTPIGRLATFHTSDGKQRK